MEFIKVPLKDIIIKTGRGRKEFKHIQELADSIKRQGFINPICVAPSVEQPGKYELIAGERRWRASCLAGLSEVPVTFRSHQTDLERKIMELEENTHREGLDWQEEAELHAQIDEHRKLLDGSWNQKQTAELVGVSPAHVNLQIAMAKKLRENPAIAKEIRERNLPINAAAQVMKAKENNEKMERLRSAGKLEITTDLKLGDCRELIKLLPPASVDLCITDPPYGLEKLEAIREGGGSRMSGHALMGDDHNSNITAVLQLLREMAPELVRVMKPGGHIYIFTAFQYAGQFIEALAPLEFQPPGLVWVRGSVEEEKYKSTTPGYGYNYLSCTEYVLMFHNPPRSRRLAKNMPNILQHPEVPKNLRVYPTEKPQSLLKDLIAQSSTLGDTVLDFTAGSASTLKAARALGRKSIGFEKNQESWTKAQLILSGQINEAEGQGSLLADESPEALLNSAKF